MQNGQTQKCCIEAEGSKFTKELADFLKEGS
jgi:hypothetical protein